MDDSIKYFGKIKPVKLSDKEEAQRYLDYGNSYVVRSKDDLTALMDRGEVFTAAELATRQQAEQEAKSAFEAAVEEQGRMQRHQQPKLTGDILVTYTRERFKE